MARYLVVVTIENKDQVGDPEGETIKNDLILKSGYSNVESVRSAKCYNIIINTETENDAKKEVTKLCEQMHNRTYYQIKQVIKFLIFLKL